ncbi:tetratricopeptide repeat protein [uncultured Campylobacter sp.]|uniref:tetratricopeptide repeat protein n=1 Tax=uncultured Campylobacter sp. TaxID=218934 RepID=UPI0026163A26|nr:tetratricopeptide repeat protein [uncultured Campylobacter sp.]
MKRVFILLVILFSIGFSKNIFELGQEAYGKGDYQKAAKLWQKACDEGDAGGCSGLGALYEYGKGVRQDYQKAVQFYQKACDGGVDVSCFSLGFLYQNGKGVRQNFSTAKEYYGKACDLGLQPGCNNYRILNEIGY